MKKAVLVLHRAFYRFLQERFMGCKEFVKYHDVRHLMMSGIRGEEGSEYMFHYLFGGEFYHGMIRDYLRQGYSLDIWEEGFFVCARERVLSQPNGIVFDFQFSTNVPDDLIQIITQNGGKVFGWASPCLGSKWKQYQLLRKTPYLHPILPQQKVFFSIDSIYKSERVLSSSGFLIAKPAFAGSNGFPNGYLVFHQDQWIKFMQMAQECPFWFQNNGVLVSELIQTRDPFLFGNNSVVHKVHIPSGYSSDKLANWPLCALRIPGNISFDKIGSYIKPLGEVLEGGHWSPGSLDSYREILLKLAANFSVTPCLFGIDVMIGPDGNLYFLEANKLAATYFDKCGREKTPLERYMKLLLG